MPNTKQDNNLTILNAHLFDPAMGLDMPKATLVIRDGVIADYDSDLSAPENYPIINAHGLMVAPGLIDMDVVDHDPLSALSGGITTIATANSTWQQAANGPKLHIDQSLSIHRPLAHFDGLATAGDTATRMGLSSIAPSVEAQEIANAGAGLIGPITSFEGVYSLKPDQSALTHPAYFSMNELAIVGYDTRAKMTPPLRPEEDRQAVIRALNDDKITIIASGHVKTTRDDKSQTFIQAKAGMPAQQTLLTLCLELVHMRASTLEKLLPKMTRNPAEYLGLAQGRIAKGAPADLIIIDPEKPFRLNANRNRDDDLVCPLDRRPVQGCVMTTIIDGTIAYQRT